MSTDISPNLEPPEKELNPIVIDGISYIPSSALLSGASKVSFKDNRAFAVLNTSGECTRMLSGASELGFYFNDTRYLGIWEMTINGQSPVALAHESRFSGNSIVFSMTNRDFQKIDGTGRVPRETFLVRRILTFNDDTLFETVEIKNFSNEPQLLQIEHWSGGKFEDVFEVRGFARAKRGKVLPPQEPSSDLTVLQYEGLDGLIRRSYIHRLYGATKIRLSPALAGYFARVQIPPKGTHYIKTIVSFDRLIEPVFRGVSYKELSIAEKMRILEEKTPEIPLGSLSVKSDNAIVTRAIENAELDIFMLLGRESVVDLGSGEIRKVLYPYAGVPWFSAPFGRDGMITAYQMLPWHPSIANGVLEYAFQTLGTKVDAFTDQQPGKVFHEMRRGEMSNAREVPFIPYYGSVDSTPLCLILLHEYIRWTKDIENLKRWWPQALKALEWIEKWGDFEEDGFLEYAQQSPSGLINQGWKDSVDSVMHADGRLAHAPIRLCEAQAYAFRARLGMSSLAKLLGEEELSGRLRLEALRLKAQFIEKFWDPDEKYIYLALDGNSQPCQVKSSNMGHCLWSQILNPDQAKSVADHLMSDCMFSGYGVRTLSSKEKSYNPLSYHNGSIWPHDNSLIMEGLRNYGFREELEKLSLALIDVLETSDDFRLPELYCGFRKRDDAPPVPYEVACKPQAWAAGSVFLMLKSMLGLSMDADQNYVVFNSPILTPRIQSLEIRGLRGRDWEMDLRLRRGASGVSVDTLRKSGKVRVLIVK